MLILQIRAGSFLLLLSLLACTPYIPNKNCYRCHSTPAQKTYRQGPPPRVLHQGIRIRKTKYIPIDQQHGLWSGYFEGDDDCELRLNFYDRHRLVDSRHIGYQSPRKNEGANWFKFKSANPEERDYQWKVEAYLPPNAISRQRAIEKYGP